MRRFLSTSLVVLGVASIWGCQGGEATTNRIGVVPSRLDFGVVQPGSSSTLEVTVTNLGSADFTFGSVTLEGDDRGAFQFSLEQLRIVPESSAKVRIQYQPAHPGEDSATLVIPVPGRDDSRVLLTGKAAYELADAGVPEPDAGDVDAGVDAGEMPDASIEPFHCGADDGVVVHEVPVMGHLLPVGDDLVVYGFADSDGGTEVGAVRLRAPDFEIPAEIHWLSPQDGVDSYDLSLAWNGTELGAVFLDEHQGFVKTHTFFERVDPELVPVAGSLLPVTPGYWEERSPVVTWNGRDQEWGIAFTQVHETPDTGMFARVSSTGELQDGGVVDAIIGGVWATDMGKDQLVWNGERYAATWQPGHIPAHLVELSATGEVDWSTETELDPGSADFGVAWSGSEYGVAGDVLSSAPPYRHFELFERVSRGGGLAPGSPPLSSLPTGQFRTAITWTGSRWIIVSSRLYGEATIDPVVTSVLPDGSLECTETLTRNPGWDGPVDVVWHAGRAWMTEWAEDAATGTARYELWELR